MRRAPGLTALTRRDFCALAGLGVLAAGCTDGGITPIETGGLGGGNHNGPDAGPGSNHQVDAGVPPTDSGSMATCTGSPVDVGAASMYTTNNPVIHGSSFFVVRDSGGLYALSAKCTHEGATCQVQSGDFYCPRHGAEFTFNGAVIGGPVFQPLVHYSMCILPNGHVGVDTTKTVSASTRLVA